MASFSILSVVTRRSTTAVSFPRWDAIPRALAALSFGPGSSVLCRVLPVVGIITMISLSLPGHPFKP